MSILAPLCQQLKHQFTPKKQTTSKPVGYWSEKDRLHDSVADAFVIILRTRGCSWAHSSGCSMCGYFNDSNWNDIVEEQIQNQFKTAMKHYTNQPIIKIFNSGSFFDTQELPPTTQQVILAESNQYTEKIVVESRPEFITNKIVNKLEKNNMNKKIEVGIGLETANDHIRTHAINKGFTYNDFKKAATILKNHHIGIKTYLLIKPPLLTEQEAIDDTLSSIKIINDISTTISLNPCNIQRHTVVEYLWKRQYYRPPWLWSIIDILKKSSQLTNTRIQCDIAGGGSSRGAHNCPECNRNCLDAIHQYSLTQDTSYLTKPKCDCKDLWKTQCLNEQQTFGSLNDYQKVTI